MTMQHNSNYFAIKRTVVKMTLHLVVFLDRILVYKESFSY